MSAHPCSSYQVPRIYREPPKLQDAAQARNATLREVLQFRGSQVPLGSVTGTPLNEEL